MVQRWLEDGLVGKVWCGHWGSADGRLVCCLRHISPCTCAPPPPPPQVAEEDLQRVAEATGAQVQTTVNSLTPKALGSCALFEERQVGAERYNLFTGGWGLGRVCEGGGGRIG